MLAVKHSFHFLQNSFGWFFFHAEYLWKIFLFYVFCGEKFITGSVSYLMLSLLISLHFKMLDLKIRSLSLERR